MLIREIMLEGYYSDLVVAVQDLLTRAMTKDLKKLSTVKFKDLLAKQGYVATVDEIIQAVDQSGFASSVNKDFIVPADELSADIKTDNEPSVDVGKKAGDQALSDIKSGL
jgi:hypothetical protein